MLEAIDGCPAADIAITAPETVFAFSEVKLGIIPAAISPFALAKIGPGAAVLRLGLELLRELRHGRHAHAEPDA